jgi:hypothetical protein
MAVCGVLAKLNPLSPELDTLRKCYVRRVELPPCVKGRPSQVCRACPRGRVQSPEKDIDYEADGSMPRTLALFELGE